MTDIDDSDRITHMSSSVRVFRAGLQYVRIKNTVFMIFIIWITFSLKNIDIRSDLIQRDEWHMSTKNNCTATRAAFVIWIGNYHWQDTR